MSDMESYLRLALLSIAAIILFLIFFDAWFRQRHLRKAEMATVNSNYSVVNLTPAEDPDLSTFEMEQHEEPTILSSPLQIKQIKTECDSSMEPLPPIESDLLTISIVAKSGFSFAGYDLLQAISATGMKFGAMNIFHYISGNKTLFSMASATEPGEFNLDRIGDFSCAGLTLFMNLSDVPNPKRDFILMFKIAEQLADDLGGDLYARPRVPWNEEILHHYQQKASCYESI
ncbi:MAG TPA: cell division protein ZipA C-terminal FtsZ-binding domain-containing protein [Gammaproteobacteria bacterium]|nr:cell division protein ZipA C-terminal FtsZ-binding domain-containing protein [Gammaproteobacteria bacterium]